jgi:hypothetical protein
MEDVLSTLNQLVSSVNLADTSLERVVKSKRAVKEAIKVVKQSIPTERKDTAHQAYKDALKLTLDQASLIYAKNVADAVSKSPEYKYGQFLSPLIDVGNNDNLYRITPIGIGWSMSIVVHLAMDEIAGTLSDYAEAVESARGALEVKEERDPELASTYWRKKIYGGPRYFTTIQLRLLAAVSPAPFWSLLNYGSKNATMESDIGGTPYPSRGGHHFVERTEEEIRRFFVKTFYSFRDEKGDDSKVNVAIAEANAMLTELQAKIDMMSNQSEMMDKIAKEIGVSANKLDASKIIKYAEMVKNGEPLPGQIDVGRFADDRIRVRNKKLAEILSGGY